MVLKLNVKKKPGKVGSKSSDKTPSKVGKAQAEKDAAKAAAALAAKEAAEAAVEEAEEAIKAVHAANAAFEENFPEACEALEAIDVIRTAAEELIISAKPLVAVHKQSVGSFTAKRSFRQAHYDDKDVHSLFADGIRNSTDPEQTEAMVNWLVTMFTRGGFKGIKLDADVARIIITQNPELGVFLQEAFVERREQTTSVSVPSI